ncbi:hypothetical protein D3C77_598610 [compost metagenome]
MRPIAGKPAPTGFVHSCRSAVPVGAAFLKAALYLWELACRRWAAKQPQGFSADAQIAGAALTSRRRPPPREHLLHPGFGEALVDQDQNATVLVAPDDPACRLDDLAHARVEIGVIEPRTKLPPQTLLELLVDRVDLG